MPNLVGIFEPDTARDVLHSRLGRQLAAIAATSRPLTEHSLCVDSFAIGVLDTGILEQGRQIAASPDGRYHLVIDGELWNADELAARHRRDTPRVAGLSSQGDLILGLITAHGPEIVREFNGLFAIVLHDAVTRSVTLISDRYGFRPLFFKATANGLVFSTELKGIRAADSTSLKLNAVGLFELLCHGHHLYGDTWVDGYERLAPATILSCGASGTSRRNYWRYAYQEGEPEHDQPTYFVNFAKLLDRAVERCMRGPARIGMFLSGGYDSRSVAAAVRPHHLPIPTFTFGLGTARDVLIAPQLAERLGMQHTHLVSDPGYLSAHCHGIVWRTEGMLSFTRTTSMQFHPQLQQSMDIVLTGFLAEFSGSHTWPALLLARSRGAAIDAIWNRIIHGKLARLQRIMTPAFYAQNLEAAKQRFTASFSSIDNDHPLNVADVWNMRFMQPQVTYQAPAVDRHILEVRAPHMDTDLVNFLLKIPPRARLEQRIYKKMIAYSYPAVRDVPCTNSGRPIDPLFAREYVKMASEFAMRRGADLMRKAFGSGQPLRREMRDLAGDVRAEPQLADAVLRPMLASGIFPTDMFSRDGIEEIIAAHYSGRERHEELLSLLISFGLAFRFIVLGDVVDAPKHLRGS
ncbi:MAG: hypothetical protein KKF85_08075 [Gammaproteobacteria bacterium]|nr:hypothetical protein [Rhodocyclaceae bacterium]MBU3910155.1 hypothetical protein [Gammaproteobacteria bacterium]MBU3989689.1 hypothetical protein [Gammaproteobacteria bacterium]MBU4006162.1 hypothetical protein [Gammaproteobacteria bacterium]MBU4022617.1 hypothetical protein [Gammaproteobacteria bacterium]